VYLAESHVLQGVSFAVAEGGVTALLGRNGVGKTTTLRAMHGARPRRGRIDARGEAIDRLPTHRSSGAASATCPRTATSSPGYGRGEPAPLGSQRNGARYDLVYDPLPRACGQRARAAGGDAVRWTAADGRARRAC
jgi:branched-chain amino acid transport system ATP-binding protein